MQTSLVAMKKVFSTSGVIFVLSLFLYSHTSFAAKFANQFCEFEIPPQWQCNLEGAEWVCQSSDPSKKKDAIIILAAKLKGDQDSLDQYLAYLKKAKAFTSIAGKPVKSESKYAKTVQLSQHPWVDSLHLDSEIPGFYTRYLATIKKDIGVLVTYSINKDKYRLYLNDFETMVKTLKVFRKTGGLNAGSKDSNLFKNTIIPQHISEGTVFPGAEPEDDEYEEEGTKKKSDGFPLWLLLVAGGAVAFIIVKKRQG